jgi:hypothetical protein
VGLGPRLCAVPLAEADRVGRRKLGPHEVHSVRADTNGAPDEDVLVSQPHVRRPWGAMVGRARMFDHFLTYFRLQIRRETIG